MDCNNKLFIDWEGYTWRTQERWGQVHPDDQRQWYDPCAVKIKDDGSLSLFTHNNEKYFKEFETESEIGVGLISSKEPFFHGRFEVDCMLPKGKKVWPAFWMWGWSSWPPEIDVFEGYTNKRKSYFRPRLKNLLGFWDVQSNFHYYNKERDKNDSTGSKPHFISFKNPSKHYFKYAVEWLPDKIEIFYNGRRVRKIDDKKIMEQMNSSNGMNVILNNAVNVGADPTDCFSEFKVRSFKYEGI